MGVALVLRLQICQHLIYGDGEKQTQSGKNCLIDHAALIAKAGKAQVCANGAAQCGVVQSGAAENKARHEIESHGCGCNGQHLNGIVPDYGVGGIVLVAKNKLAAKVLSADIFDKKIHKSYLAFLCGAPQSADGEICAPIKREKESIIKRIVADDGAYSLTKYKVIASSDMLSLVEASPITGRTHQLRVHFAHIGHPICGDTLYGYPSHFINRQALHAYKISFTHPISREPLTITASLPQDMLDLYRLAFPENNSTLERIFK